MNINGKEAKITILCSTVDRASRNIKEHILKMREWVPVNVVCHDWKELVSVYSSEGFWLVEIDAHHIYQDRIDRKLEACGLKTRLIIVASKHKSKDGNRVLTAHYTGNSGDAQFGGKTRELSYPAPFALRSILLNMQKMANGIGYEVTMESTHHGPTDVSLPMVYAEIGSAEEQWKDPVAGQIAAMAILNVKEDKMPIAVGFGGGHYAKRQSKLLLENNITFGHNFSNHQLDNLDQELVRQAIEKSNADLIYFDRRAMSSAHKEIITGIIKELGLQLLRESDITDMQRLPWHIYSYMLRLADRLCPGSRLRITNGFRQMISDAGDVSTDEIQIFEMDEGIFSEAVSADKTKVTEVLGMADVVYLERDNGTLIGIMMCKRGKEKASADMLIDECIKILKEHYEIKYIPEEMTLYITEERFNPELARELGVPPGPMFAELKNGNPVTANGKIVEPLMVYTKTTRRITLVNNITLK
jgi:D-aminoacyl-tRNA deacylase